MKFNEKHEFARPAAEVLRMFSDRSYFERKYRELGFWNIEVLEHEQTGARFRITVRYSARNDAPLPDFARKFVGESNVVTQTDRWDLQRRTGRLEAEIRGVPVKVVAEMALQDEGSGCANHLRWSVSCPLPLIGGKLEQVVAADIQAKSRADVEQTRKILASY